jgi:hypothetical protein
MANVLETESEKKDRLQKEASLKRKREKWRNIGLYVPISLFILGFVVHVAAHPMASGFWYHTGLLAVHLLFLLSASFLFRLAEEKLEEYSDIYSQIAAEIAKESGADILYIRMQFMIGIAGLVALTFSGGWIVYEYGPFPENFSGLIPASAILLSIFWGIAVYIAAKPRKQ